MVTVLRNFVLPQPLDSGSYEVPGFGSCKDCHPEGVGDS